MTLTYFSVDVETTSTNPFDVGDLLSVGVQAVAEDGSFLDAWYTRTTRNDGMPHRWGDSKDWWATQEEENPLAWTELFSPNRESMPEARAAAALVDFVGEQTNGGDRRDAVFVAHPASFDYAWVQRMLTGSGIPGAAEVFSYRTLDLRSAGWALDPSESMRNSVRGHKSEIPHHALHDAVAQAKDLRDIIAARQSWMDAEATCSACGGSGIGRTGDTSSTCGECDG